MRKSTAVFVVAGILLGALALGAILFLVFTDGMRGPRVVIGEATFAVEVADTPALRERGLGYRDSLCESCGMLFVFGHKEAYGFWMKGMRFPIDILWIRDGTIIHIERSVDFRDQQRIYRPDTPADHVLELPAGTCEKRHIQRGDRVVFLDG